MSYNYTDVYILVLISLGLEKIWWEREWRLYTAGIPIAATGEGIEFIKCKKTKRKKWKYVKNIEV